MKKLLLLLLSVPCFAQNKEVIAPGGNLITEGIPAIPSSIAQDVRRYTESRSAGFAEWHPKKREMIISTRFANVPQLHEVRMPMGDRKQLTFFEEPLSNASYEPVAGSYFLFTKDVGGNEFAQIYKYETKDGTISMITPGGRSQNGGIVWNHKGDRIAYGSTRRNGADRDIYLMDPTDPTSDHLLLEVKGGGWGVADWSPSDKRLLVSEYISANESHYWLVDVAAATKEELTSVGEQGVSYDDARFSKDGKGVYLLTDKDNEFKRLAYMDLSIRKLSYFTSAIPWDVDAFDLSEDGKQIAFTTNEAGSSRLYLFQTATKQYKPVAGLPQGVYSGPSFHHNSNDLALSISSARAATDVYTVTTATGKVQRWTESEMGGLVAAALQEPRLIKWTSFDGREISGFYYAPPARFTGKRPVMILIHGGPESQSRPGYFGSSNYYLNELGVAILVPNVRGSSGYGKTFLGMDNGMKREESVQDIGALLDWVGKQPELDAGRVMVMGGSYGGYMTLAVSTNYSDRIRCAVDIVGISHFGTFLKNTESYRRDLRRAEYGNEQDPAMAAFFEKISPLNNAAKIKKPLFIVQGTNDPRVPRTEAVQMAEKVRQGGTTVWYLEAKDEGHGFNKKNNADFQRYATILFMKQYLLDGM